MSSIIKIVEVFRSEKFGNVYGAEAVSDVKKDSIPNVTSMRRYRDDITEVEAGLSFGFGLDPDPGLTIGQVYTFDEDN
ncbi:hypothetical protein [Microbacterium testaceum]|uniref:Uncharacterized protein n=1 Tax=Microbacterium testaceum TaxID=2033 RepID=A0A2T7WNF0_MICTE|nr:hypothetical protein [Microbacterium testaceum]PVE76108.1 hypothetical protein DC432_06645 [Microbacterium testaceum]